MNSLLLLLPSRLVDALMPPRLADPEARRGSRLVIKVALITLSVSCLMQVVYYLEDARMIALLTAISIGLQVLGLVLHRATGSYRVGGHAHVFALWSLFLGIGALSGGIDSPNIVANFFVIVLAPLLLGRRHGLFWLVAVAGGYVFQFQLAAHGLVQQTLSAADIASTRLAELTVTSITTGLTAYVFAKGEERMRAEVAREKQLIEAVNQDLRIILDNTGQGFLSLDGRGRLVGERSAVIDVWFEGAGVGRHFWELLRPLDARVAERFESEWSQVEAGILPYDICLEQLPKLLLVDETSLALEYRAALVTDERVEKLVVIISDISAEVARQEAELRQRDLIDAFERILRDPEGFAVFLKSADRDVRDVQSGRLAGGELKRCLHTLKGNSAMMGLSALARSCHELEDELERDGELRPLSLRRLAREFSAVEGRLASFVTASSSDLVLSAAEHDAFLRALAARKPHQELLQKARSWSEPRVGRHLKRLGEHAEQLARRLDKGELDVTIEGGELRMHAVFADFWDVAVHVVRNAVDHGVESPEARARAGKGTARMSLRALVWEGRSVVEIGDDGRGVDWERVRELARTRDLPVETEADLLAALLADGFSTRAAVTEVSGRGAGLSSVRKVCQDLGIEVSVRSKAGGGTTFCFVFPDLSREVRPLAAALS